MINSRSIVIGHDLAMIVVAWVLAIFARFNFEIPPVAHLDSGLRALPIVAGVQALILWHFGLYRGLWRFASLQDLWNIIRSATLGAVSVALALFFVTRLNGIPRSLLILYPIFLLLLLGGPRLAYRLWKDRSLNLRQIRTGQRVLIVGAGEGGEALLRDMLRDSTYVPIGLVDDRRGIIKRRIHGVAVLGAVADIPRLVLRYQIDLVIIAIPSASNAEMQRMVEICEQAGCAFRTLPRLQDIVIGNVGLREVREVAIDDLLGRTAVELDWRTIQARLVGKAVLVTGGGGSIGSELCRQVARLGASRLIIFEQSEHSLYVADRELREAHPHLQLSGILGDVCDEAALEHVFRQFKPEVVFHAAAYKHVPIVETQIREGVRNNVLGTHLVATAAARHGAEIMVLISTDKAVKPSSVMGATKRVAELICETTGSDTRTQFITVRFGNVLGSAGSVVPLFQQQIRRGGPVTVTHPEATRFFMTIPEACQLILQAAAQGRGGEIFVLEMGQPVNIKYLAEQMIRLSGHEPGRDIKIVYSGLRPGEKLQEELFHQDEKLVPTRHEKLLLAAHSEVNPERIREIVQRLTEACDQFDEPLISKLLKEAVPGLNVAASFQSESARTVIPFKRGVT